MRRITFLLVSFAVVALAIPGLAAWQPSANTLVTHCDDVSAGGITGIGGTILLWTKGQGEEYMLSESGRFGGWWQGAQYQKVSWYTEQPPPPVPFPPAVNVAKSHSTEHEWEPKAHGKTRIKLEMSQSTAASGGACQDRLDDESWFWCTVVEIEDQKPTVTAGNFETGEWDDVEMTENNSYEHIKVKGTGGHLSPPHLATLTAGFAVSLEGEGNESEGEYAAQSSRIDHNDYSGVKVKYVVETEVNRTADSAAVTAWEIYMEATLKTIAF